jgi:archaellum component FlaC
MPTQEERLTTLEYNLDQFKAEPTTYYEEMALQVTMTKSLTEDAVKRLMQLRVQVDKRFNSTDQQLAEVKQELAGVKQDLGVVRQDLAGVKHDISEHTTRLNRLETKVDTVQTTLVQILARLPEKP